MACGKSAAVRLVPPAYESTIAVELTNDSPQPTPEFPAGEVQVEEQSLGSVPNTVRPFSVNIYFYPVR